MAKSLDFDTPMDKMVQPVRGAAGAESQIPLEGDLTIGGSKVINGVEVAGPEDLFDYLNEIS